MLLHSLESAFLRILAYIDLIDYGIGSPLGVDDIGFGRLDSLIAGASCKQQCERGDGYCP